MALRTAETIAITYASVDIVALPDDPKGKKLRVIEVNSAVLLDHQAEKHKEISIAVEHRIYTKIVQELFSQRPSSQKESPIIATPQRAIAHQMGVGEEKAYALFFSLARLRVKKGGTAPLVKVALFSSLNGKENRFVYDYHFPLNQSAAAAICDNKAAASACLKKAGIPQIRHRLFKCPDPVGLEEESAFAKMHAFARQCNYDVVLKPASGIEGAGGSPVFKMHKMLDDAARKIFASGNDLVLTRFRKIRSEYSLIMLNGKAEVIFRKVPPFVVGDGQKVVSLLITEYLGSIDPIRREEGVKNISPDLFLSSIPAKDEQVFLHWKHNLGQGATCELLGGASCEEMSDWEGCDGELIALATKTANVLDASFVSVDIAEIDGSMPNLESQFRVMEVNAGIMYG